MPRYRLTLDINFEAEDDNEADRVAAAFVMFENQPFSGRDRNTEITHLYEAAKESPLIEAGTWDFDSPETLTDEFYENL